VRNLSTISLIQGSVGQSTAGSKGSSVIDKAVEELRSKLTQAQEEAEEEAEKSIKKEVYMQAAKVVHH